MSNGYAGSPDLQTPLLTDKGEDWAKEGGWTLTMDPVLLESAVGNRSYESTFAIEPEALDLEDTPCICECNPDENGNPTVSQDLSCQGKVSDRKMKMVDYEKICKCTRTYITVNSEEMQRLEKVWKTSEAKWESIWNEKEQCYIPKFLE